MARVIKVDNAILKRRAYKRGKKQVGFRKARKHILIVCEGIKTEPNYFESIKNTLNNNVLETYDIDVKGTGTSTLKIIEIAIELRKKAAEIHNKEYDQVWAVFDKDSFPVADFNNAIFKAKAKGIKCGWSNEAFELWYILHFQYRNTSMSRDDYKKCIEKECSKSIHEKTGKKTDFEYLKNSEKMYSILEKYGDQEQAIKWAKSLDALHSNNNFASHNPCTKVYELIIVLNEIRDSIN